jgi:predicted enzyme related to lactoylglutathione lyase
VHAIDAFVCWTRDLDRCVRFYRALGLMLVEERHDEGPLHFACELGSAHFAIYAAESGPGAPPRRSAGASQLGFQIAGDLEATLEQALAAGGTMLVALEDVPWGKRAVLQDPDGRAVELNQR